MTFNLDIIIHKFLFFPFLGNTGGFFTLEKVNENAFRITLAKDLIIESDDSHSRILNIKFISPKSIYTYVRVNILIIELPLYPEFDLPIYNVTVDENEKNGFIILDIDIITLLNPDDDVNFKIIEDDDPDFPFSINQNNFILKLKFLV